MPRKKKLEHERDFDSMNEEDKVAQLLKDFNSAESNQSAMFARALEWYKQYRGFLREEDKTSDRSNLYIPYTLTNVETVKAKLVNSLFKERPFVETMALNDTEDAEKQSKLMDKFLQYQMEQKIKIIPKSAEIILEMLLYGDAITEQKWDYRTKMKNKRRFAKVNKEETKSTTVFEEEKIVTHDHPDMELVSFFDFFHDPTATSVGSSMFAIRRKYADYSELLADGKYKNLKKLADEKNEKFGTSDYDPATILQDTDEMQNKRNIELLHYWTEDHHFVLANRKVVILEEKNIYHHGELPFAKWSFIPISGEWNSIGLVELSTHLQSELNTVRNQRIDNVSMTINQMYKVRRGSNIEEEDLVSRPNGVVYVDDPEDVVALEIPDVTSSAYLEEDVIKSDFDRVTGVHDIHRGESSGKTETATKASIIDQHGNERFLLNLKLIEFGGFKDAMAQIIQLNEQFIDKDTPFIDNLATGKYKYETMTVEAIIGEYDIVAVGNSSSGLSNKEIKQNQLVNMLGQMAPYAGIVNVPELIRRVFDAFELRNVDSLVKTEEQIKKEQEQARAQEQAQQQQQAQPQPQPQPMAPGGGQGVGQGLEQIVPQVVQLLSQQFQGVQPEVLAQVVVAVLQKQPIPKELESLVPMILEAVQFVIDQQGGAR